MMQLVIILECSVEDIDEAKAKTEAVKTILEVYPFVRVSASCSEQIQTKNEGGE